MATASDTIDRPLPHAHRPGPVGRIGGAILDVLQIIGEAVLVLVRTLGRIRLNGRAWTRFMAQMVRIGTDTLPLTFLVSLFVGMVLVVQAADQLAQYTQEILGSIVGLAM